MKKYITAVLLAGVLLTACAKETSEPAANTEETAEAAAQEESAAPEVEEPNTLFNDFFAPSLKEFDLPEGEDEMVTVVFQFVNITDKTYYKNDEEIPVGGSWEKTISYPREKWEGMAGEDCWLHYDLYEDDKMQTQIYKGGLKFTVSDDLQVTDISLFED